MSVYIKSRKHGTVFNAHLSVRDGQDYVSLSQYAKGDSVHILFDVTPTQAHNINQLAESNVRAYNTSVGTSEWMVHIPFTIVSLVHSLSYAKGNTHTTEHLRPLTTSIYLEAENGWWEDIYCWLIHGEHPVWAEQEGEAA